MTKRLIINADDFGYPQGTVEAIATLYEAGVVTSATALVNQTHWPQAAAYLREHPKLGAGVHLVANEGRPILPREQVPSLVNAEGFFRDGAWLLLRYGRLRTTELEAEMSAQIEKFIADTGRRPDHLDIHCHYLYVFPAWFRVSLKLAQAFGGLPVRLPFDDSLQFKAAQMSGAFPACYIRWQGRRYQRMVAQYGLARPNYFESSFSLRAADEQRSAEYLLKLLDALPEGVTELLAHPGTEDWRARDYQALLDPRVRQRIAALGIEMSTFGDVGA